MKLNILTRHPELLIIRKENPPLDFYYYGREAVTPLEWVEIWTNLSFNEVHTWTISFTVPGNTLLTCEVQTLTEKAKFISEQVWVLKNESRAFTYLFFIVVQFW